MIIRGKHLLLLTLVFLAVASWGIYWALHLTADRRFAIGLYPQGQALPRGQYLTRQEGKLLPIDRPLVLRIERGTAGRSPFQAVGLLLGGDGAVVGAPRQMAPARLDDGHLSEEARFPPLGSVPAQHAVAAAVVRLPEVTPQRLAEIGAALHGPLQAELDRLVELGRAAGGHTEVQIMSVE